MCPFENSEEEEEKMCLNSTLEIEVEFLAIFHCSCLWEK